MLGRSGSTRIPPGAWGARIVVLVWLGLSRSKREKMRACLPSGGAPRAEPDPEALVIGQRIRQLREEADLGLEELAHAADFSKGHLSNLERGYVMPTVATLRVLANALDVLVADLVIDPRGATGSGSSTSPGPSPRTIERLAKDSARSRRRS